LRRAFVSSSLSLSFVSSPLSLSVPLILSPTSG
jgi:hypothetical protein